MTATATFYCAQCKRDCDEDQIRRDPDTQMLVCVRCWEPVRFLGELVTCIMCSAQERSDPGKRPQWHAVHFDGYAYHACPKHFPPDRAGTAEELVDAYRAFFKEVIRRFHKDSAAAVAQRRAGHRN